jgi:Fe-S-cluster containining protein
VTDLDCTACGACCVTAGDVAVYPADTTPAYLTRSVRNLVGYAPWDADDFRIMKRRPDGGCTALTGEVGTACRCRIYERRPEICREFQPGSFGCLVARREAGLGPREATDPEGVSS